MDWQPIETVPSETLILVLLEGDVYQAYRSDKGCWSFPCADFHGCGCCSGDRDYPTHWMHLPEPPKT